MEQSKEPQPVPEEIKPVLKSMEQVLKESYEKHTRANPGEKWTAWEDCKTDKSNSLCYEAMANWANQCTTGLSARLDWQINQSFKQSEEITTLEQTIVDYDKQVLEQKGEIESHVNKLKELQGLIERYRKIEAYDSNKCGNHVYNEIMEHLAKHNL